MTYEATELALELPCIIVQHAPTGDYLLDEYSSLREAIEGEQIQVDDELLNDGDEAMIVEYDVLDCEEAARQGYDWPLILGLVEEIDDDLLAD